MPNRRENQRATITGIATIAAVCPAPVTVRSRYSCQNACTNGIAAKLTATVIRAKTITRHGPNRAMTGAKTSATGESSHKAETRLPIVPADQPRSAPICWARTMKP